MVELARKPGISPAEYLEGEKVLSDSTERDNRSDKFYAYRRLPGLEEYMLVAQDVRRVEVYRRDTGWDLEVCREAGNFDLRCLGLELPIADVYEGVLAAL